MGRRAAHSQPAAAEQGHAREHVTVDVPLVYTTQEQEFRLPQIVGYIETNDGTVLLDGTPGHVGRGG